MAAKTAAAQKVAPLAESLEKRALVIPLGRPGYLMAITPKKGRWALDSEMRAAGFSPEYVRSMMLSLMVMFTSAGTMTRKRLCAC